MRHSQAGAASRLARTGAFALLLAAVAAVTSAVHALHPGIPVVPTQSSGASDGIYFRAGGIPTYRTGSSFIKDEDEFAHGLDERLPVDSFYQDLKHWDLLVKALAGPRAR